MAEIRLSDCQYITGLLLLQAKLSGSCLSRDCSSLGLRMFIIFTPTFHLQKPPNLVVSSIEWDAENPSHTSVNEWNPRWK